MLFLLGAPVMVAAQSTEAEYPTPVRAADVGGSIGPRDVGDPRLTRHFYALTGTPGDLTVTVESTNLNGDVDVFTAGTLRPLAKLSFYAAGAGASVTAKSFYLKSREGLVLRVEARTPNDSPGSYRIRFSGSFEPISGDVPAPELIGSAAATQPATAPRGVRRVTATGARVEEPEVAVAAPPMTENTPASPAETNPAATPSRTETPTAETAPARRSPRAARQPRTAPRRARPARTARPPVQTPAPAETTTATTPSPTESAAAPTAPPTPAGPRLIIETTDGLRVERYMANVRRVTVENGQVVVVTRDGKVERRALSKVSRMAIEP